MQLSSLSLALTRAGIVSTSYDPRLVFGSDLVTWYGNSVDDLWRAQSTGGPVTLYQDSAGTTPVTAIGQSVGRINDLSGNGYHLTQSTATARGTLQSDGDVAFLRLDGVDDRYTSSSIDLTSTDKVVVMTAFSSLSTTFSILLETSANSDTPPGAFYVAVFDATKTRSQFTSSVRGWGDANVAVSTPFLMTQIMNAAGSTQSSDLAVRINGLNASLAFGGGQGSGNFGNHPLSFGSRLDGTFLTRADVYSIPMIVKRLMTADELAAAEKAFGKSIGAL